MGIDASASLGYGFVLPESFLEKCDNLDDENDDLDSRLNPKLDLMFSGQEDNTKTYLVIKKSLIQVFDFENHKKLNLDKISESYASNISSWDKILTDWAKENKLPKPKISWWLCSSLS